MENVVDIVSCANPVGSVGGFVIEQDAIDGYDFLFGSAIRNNLNLIPLHRP